MDEEDDSFAPGALFRRYGQEKKGTNITKKGTNEKDASVQAPKTRALALPKTSVALKNPPTDSGSHIKPTSSPSTSVQAPKTCTVLKNPTAEGGNQIKVTPSANETSKNNGVSDAEGQASTSAATLRPVNTNALLVNPKQRGNPILKSVCNVVWEFNDTIAPDYVMGASTCALFLSVRYHNLNPDYIHERLKLLGKQYDLRILLVQVDTTDPHHALKHLTRICILANLTLVLAWSPEEAGRILEVYKSFEHKPPDLIMERKESNPHQKIINALTSIRSVNKTDAGTLLSTFGSLESLLKSPRDTVSLCPGLGPQKANRLFNVLHQPFLKSATPSKGTKRKSLN